MALDFDGTDDFVVEEYPATVPYPFTMACWFNSDTTNANRSLMTIGEVTAGGGSGTNNQNSLMLRLTSTGLVEARSSASNGTNVAQTTNTYSLTTWQHAAAKFSSNASRQAFLDGSPSSINTNTRGATNVLDTQIIGRGVGGTHASDNPMNGRLAEAAVWNVSLTDAEIKSLATGVSPRLIRPGSLIFYTPLIRSANDYSGGVTTTTGTTVAVHPRRIG